MKQVIVVLADGETWTGIEHCKIMIVEEDEHANDADDFEQVYIEKDLLDFTDVNTWVNLNGELK